MKLVFDNFIFALKVTLNWCRYFGIFIPDELTGRRQKLLVQAYSVFMFMLFIGFFIITQIILFILVWGDLSLMTDVGLVLGTNLALSAKIAVFFFKREELASILKKNDDTLRFETREEGKKIISEIDRETNAFMKVFFCFGVGTVIAWFLSTPKGELHIATWYPCDTKRSPAYEIIMIHQLAITADLLMLSMIAVCRCRVKLVGLYLQTICDDLPCNVKNKLTSDEEVIVAKRIREYVIEHQAILDCISELQNHFSPALLVQLLTSVVIICVTAYQLAVEKSSDLLRKFTMASFLFGMSTEMFMFSYQGGHLSHDSMEVATAAYSCPWYTFPTSLKRSLLVIMIRAQQPALLTAGGFTTLSLETFVTIMKASYRFFTVLQEATD
uniref:Odorant receptor n=1 Tax=Bombyx mori TaxID=7091 RepID=A0A8R2QTA9_BOMMO|nr:olfactory receptor 47 isoform X1 [Bombyx mori]